MHLTLSKPCLIFLSKVEVIYPPLNMTSAKSFALGSLSF